MEKPSASKDNANRETKNLAVTERGTEMRTALAAWITLLRQLAQDATYGGGVASKLRRIIPATALVAFALALLLTACGGGDSSDNRDWRTYVIVESLL